jgi:hypothetical protein
MNGKTGNSRGPWCAAALAVAAAVAVLTTACGVVHVHFGSSGSSASAGSPTYQAELAYAQCMRAHGLPGFPNPNPAGGPSIHHQLNGNPNSPAARANDACKHLLTGGSSGTGGATATASPPSGVSADCLASRPPCYTPRQLRVAYGIQPLLDRRITGRGQTVVLPEFPPPPVTGTQAPLATTDIRQDLARFDNMFRLPAARLQVGNTLAHAKSPWLASVEEVRDTGVVHAPAPGAVIREVLILSSYTVADVALSIRQDTRRGDSGTGQLEAGS